MRRVFLLLAVAGAIAPLVLTIVFVSEHGVDFGELVDQIVASPMALLAWIDLTIACLAFFWWMSHDASRHGIDPWWPYVAATLLIGLCFALPLSLYQRGAASLETEPV